MIKQYENKLRELESVKNQMNAAVQRGAADAEAAERANKNRAAAEAEAARAAAEAEQAKKIAEAAAKQAEKNRANKAAADAAAAAEKDAKEKAEQAKRNAEAAAREAAAAAEQERIAAEEKALKNAAEQKAKQNLLIRISKAESKNSLSNLNQQAKNLGLEKEYQNKLKEIVKTESFIKINNQLNVLGLNKTARNKIRENLFAQEFLSLTSRNKKVNMVIKALESNVGAKMSLVRQNMMSRPGLIKLYGELKNENQKSVVRKKLLEQSKTKNSLQQLGKNITEIAITNEYKTAMLKFMVPNNNTSVDDLIKIYNSGRNNKNLVIPFLTKQLTTLAEIITQTKNLPKLRDKLILAKLRDNESSQPTRKNLESISQLQSTNTEIKRLQNTIKTLIEPATGGKRTELISMSGTGSGLRGELFNINKKRLPKGIKPTKLRNIFFNKLPNPNKKIETMKGTLPPGTKLQKNSAKKTVTGSKRNVEKEQQEFEKRGHKTQKNSNLQTRKTVQNASGQKGWSMSTSQTPDTGEGFPPLRGV